MSFSIDAFVRAKMTRGTRLSPARLRAALALLETLRQNPSLTLSDHLPRTKSTSGQSLGDLAVTVAERFGLGGLGSYCGERSSRISAWGQQLLDGLQDAGFMIACDDSRSTLIDFAQSVFAAHLRCFCEREPLVIRMRSRSAEAMIEKILGLARLKGKMDDVARFLVGAALCMRLESPLKDGHEDVFPLANLDGTPSLAGFQVGDALLVVATGFPHEDQLRDLSTALKVRTCEAWVLTCSSRAETWKSELRSSKSINGRRVIVRSVASFVGQRVSEIGRFSAKGKKATLESLFQIYNGRWRRYFGNQGLRIVIDPSGRRTRRRPTRTSSNA